MMPVQATIEFALLAFYTNILVVSSRAAKLISLSGLIIKTKVIRTNTASTENSLYILTKGNFSTGSRSNT